jgi:dephospho-CoA kinase
MAKIAISGGIGAGKSTLAKRLIARGYRVLDADKLAKDCLSKPLVIAEVTKRFPELDKLGEPDFRKALAGIVFQSPNELTWLESLIHPCVKSSVNEQYQSSKNKLFFVEVPVLAATKDYDHVLVVNTPERIRIERLRSKGFDEVDIRNRLLAQPDNQEFIAAADFVFDGELSDTEAEMALTELLSDLTKKIYE